MTSYLTYIDTFCQSRTVFGIFDFTVFRVRPWSLTFRGHPRSKIFLPFESPYMTSYRTSIDTFYLVPFLRYSTSKFLGIDLDLWALEVTWDKNIFTIRRPIHDFLLNSFWHFLSISYHFRDIRLQRFWGLTFRGQLGSKIFLPFESLHMTSYLTSIDTSTLSCTVF